MQGCDWCKVPTNCNWGLGVVLRHAQGGIEPATLRLPDDCQTTIDASFTHPPIHPHKPTDGNRLPSKVPIHSSGAIGHWVSCSGTLRHAQGRGSNRQPSNCQKSWVNVAPQICNVRNAVDVKSRGYKCSINCRWIAGDFEDCDWEQHRHTWSGGLRISALCPGVHQVALLTHVDQLCAETARDITKVYRSRLVQHTVLNQPLYSVHTQWSVFLYVVYLHSPSYNYETAIRI